MRENSRVNEVGRAYVVGIWVVKLVIGLDERAGKVKGKWEEKIWPSMRGDRGERRKFIRRSQRWE